jgi:ParB family transcriptional regulator, chromosome partitioning protein
MAANNTQLTKLDVNEIVVIPGFNVRDMTSMDYHTGVADLALSIAKIGLQQPIHVTPVEGGKYGIIAGHRRFAAVNAANENLGAGIKRISAIVRRSLSEADKIVLMVSDIHSAKLSPIEVSEAVKRLVDVCGLTREEIGEKFGISQAHVSNLTLLANAHEDIKEAIKAGEISATEAVSTVREHGEDAAEVVKEAVRKAKANGKTKATAKHIKAAGGKKKPGKKDAKELVTMLMTSAKKMLKAFDDKDKEALATAADELQYCYDEAHSSGHRAR